MSRVFVDGLIINKQYHIIDNWNLNCEKRKVPIEFNGIFVKSYEFNTFNMISTRVEFIYNENGNIQIINSMNEFYELPSFEIIKGVK